MKQITKIVLFNLILFGFCNSQDFTVIKWSSLELEINRKFIGAYLDTLQKYDLDKYLTGNPPKKNDKLFIKVIIKNNEINSGGEAETKIRKFERLIVNQIPFLDRAPYSHNIISTFV